MGPRLGPLIVTSVAARIDPASLGMKILTSKPKGTLAKRIGDSKKLVGFEDNALGEAWARAIVERRRASGESGAAMLGPPLTPTDLLTTIALDTNEHLRAPCPDHHHDLCWGDEGEAFTSDAKAVADCDKDLSRLEAKGIQILGVRVAIICTRRLNEAVDRGLSRFDVDLHTMERLTLAIREDTNEDVYALCGKVGGFDFYGERFGPLNGRLHTMLVEGRERSEYVFPGVGRFAFVRDADESHLIVGLASLVGKWARDHLMRRVVRWHRSRAPDGHEIPEASGYHDPNTARFVSTTALIRKKQKVDPACFERTSLAMQSANQPPSAKVKGRKSARVSGAAASPLEPPAKMKSGVRRKPETPETEVPAAPAIGSLFD